MWNYRVIKHKDFVGIHEVYYEEDGVTIKGYTKNPVPVTGESVEDIAWIIEKMKEALSKPIIKNTEDTEQ